MTHSSSAGFSMVELLVAFGLVGTLILGLMKLFQVQGAAQRHVAQVTERQGVEEEIRNALSFREVCRRNFQAVAARPGTTANLPRLVTADGATELFRAGQTYGNGLIRLGRIRVRDFVDLAPGIGQANLDLDLTKTGAAMVANTSAPIRLFYVFDPATRLILDCSTRPLNDNLDLREDSVARTYPAGAGGLVDSDTIDIPMQLTRRTKLDAFTEVSANGNVAFSGYNWIRNYTNGTTGSTGEYRVTVGIALSAGGGFASCSNNTSYATASVVSFFASVFCSRVLEPGNYTLRASFSNRFTSGAAVSRAVINRFRLNYTLAN